MPIYEYKCQDCGMLVEKMQKISDQPLTVCENCGGKLEKQVSRSGFQFKGEGWYVTDYTNKGKSDSGSTVKSPKKEESSDSSEKSSATESTAKTDSASKTTETKSSPGK